MMLATVGFMTSEATCSTRLPQMQCIAMARLGMQVRCMRGSCTSCSLPALMH
jgi:hypothetical protein